MNGTGLGVGAQSSVGRVWRRGRVGGKGLSEKGAYLEEAAEERTGQGGVGSSEGRVLRLTSQSAQTCDLSVGPAVQTG